MNKLQKAGIALGAIGSGFVAVVGKAFAVPPTADATVVNATTDAVTGLQAELLDNLATLIPIAAVLLISVAVVFFVIRHFRAIIHG